MMAEWNSKIGELEGVSSETLERIDRVSRRSKDGRVPRFLQYVMLTRTGPAGARRVDPGQTITRARASDIMITPAFIRSGTSLNTRLPSLVCV
jgi:hypothetical protein